MFESSIDLVHDFENSDYPAADQRLILESGGWFLPVKPTAEELTAAETKSAKSRGHTRSSVSSRSSRTSSGSAAKAAEAALAKALAARRDPLDLDSRSVEEIEDWYTRVLTVYEDAADDTSLPLSAYIQLRASRLIPILKEIVPSLSAIPMASHGGLSRSELSAASDPEKLLKPTRSVGKAINMFKKTASRLRMASPTGAGRAGAAAAPPNPPSDGLGPGGKPLPVRDGFKTTNLHTIPPIQLEFQDNDNALVRPSKALYRGPLVANMEHERPPPKAPRGKEAKKRLATQERQHKEAMDTKFGDWKRRCVIGPTDRRYLKYPEARYNPLAPMSGDLLVAALYAGSVDLGETGRPARSGRSSGRSTPGPSSPGAVGSALPAAMVAEKMRRKHRSNSLAMRTEEDQLTMRHLSTTRSPIEAQHAVAAAKTVKAVVDESEHKSILRLCVLGSDAVLHRILCNYVCFRHEYEARFRKLSLRVYVAPTARHDCQLASYLARSDAWYRRQMFAPFCTPLPMVPRITPADTLGGLSHDGVASWEDELKPPVPVGMLGELLQDYVRSARYVLPLCIFDCECWEPEYNRSAGGGRSGGGAGKASPDLPDMTVPFCMGAEIGIMPRAELFRRTCCGTGSSSSSSSAAAGAAGAPPDDYSSAPPLHRVVGSKAFRKSWSKESNDVGAVDSISVTYREVSPSGHSSGSPKSLAPGSYFRIAMRNISMHADAVVSRGSPSQPGFSSMDMHLLPQSSGARFAEALQRAAPSGTKKTSNRTSQHDADVVVQAMLNEGRRLQVNCVEIQSSGEFHVLLDGELMGPFSRIRVKPCTGSNGEPIHFPISTFSPIDTR